MIPSLPLLGYPATTFWFLFISTWALAILPGFLYLTLVFPSPKWPARRFPRLTPMIVFGAAVLMQVGPFLIYSNDTVKALTLQRTTTWGLFAYLILPLIAIGHSIVTVRDPTGWARLKWVVVGVAGFVVGSLAFAFGSQAEWSVPISFIQNGGYLLLPVCIGIAIVRHRLFDIDVIIRRTLVYAHRDRGARRGLLRRGPRAAATLHKHQRPDVAGRHRRIDARHRGPVQPAQATGAGIRRPAASIVGNTTRSRSSPGSAA